MSISADGGDVRCWLLDATRLWTLARRLCKDYIAGVDDTAMRGNPFAVPAAQRGNLQVDRSSLKFRFKACCEVTLETVVRVYMAEQCGSEHLWPYTIIDLRYVDEIDGHVLEKPGQRQIRVLACPTIEVE